MDSSHYFFYGDSSFICSQVVTMLRVNECTHTGTKQKHYKHTYTYIAKRERERERERERGSLKGTFVTKNRALMLRQGTYVTIGRAPL